MILLLYFPVFPGWSDPCKIHCSIGFLNVKSLYERKVSAVGVHKGFFALFLLFFAWITGKFFLPFLFPFLLGTMLALASEPVVRLGNTQIKLPRGVASGVGVTLTLVFLLGLIFFFGALLVRELGTMTRQLPQMARQSAGLLEDALVKLCAKMPDPVGPVLTGSIHRFFQDSDLLTDRVVQKAPGILTGVLGKLPSSAMSIGTGILSGYFISARLPQLKRSETAGSWQEKWLPALMHLKNTLGKWLIAQGKLMGITYVIITAGLLLMGIPYAFAWALLVASVDAIPLLGTGTVLLPWALTKLLQGQPLLATGLLVLYLAAMLTRTALEPRFFGRHLGLDPLLMLFFLYFGYRLWGFTGIIISPLLAATTKAFTER